MDYIDSENYGNIHSTESFGTVDGPGIRYVIFMQGCTLKCKYCHNRDTWELNSGTIRHLPELVEEIKKYKPYIMPYGGVTVSGGEPLLQAKFVTKLFQSLREDGIHTVLDTAGSIKINTNIKELLKYTNLVLLDIKHIDNEKCIELTGMSNQNTFLFANYLKEQKIPVWIRQVIIPGITDDENDLLKLKEFISSLDNVEKVELLPYHNMGKYKWENLGLKYPLENIRIANATDIQKANFIIQ